MDSLKHVFSLRLTADFLGVVIELGKMFAGEWLPHIRWIKRCDLKPEADEREFQLNEIHVAVCSTFEQIVFMETQFNKMLKKENEIQVFISFEGTRQIDSCTTGLDPGFQIRAR